MKSYKQLLKEAEDAIKLPLVKDQHGKMKAESEESFEIRKMLNDHAIKQMASKFFNEHIKPMFPPNVICQSCNAENCPYNETCIKCNCQL